jgi:hypothetical protein
VARRRDGVRAPLGDIHRELSGDLHGVDERERAGLVGDVDQFADGQPGAVGPRHRTETRHAHVGHSLGEVVSVDAAALGLDDANVDALLFQALPRERPGRVFEIGPDDSVAGLPVDRVRDGVDTRSGTLREGDFVGVRPDEVGDAFPRAVVRIERHTVGVVSCGRLVLVCPDELVGDFDDVPRARAVGAEVQVDILVQGWRVGAELSRSHP